VIVSLNAGVPAPDTEETAEGKDPGHELTERLGSLPFVVVGVVRGQVDDRWLGLCDVVVDESDPALEQIRQNLEERPIAATALALLLRAQGRSSVDDGLVAESAVYSVLQAGPEFAAWRSSHPSRTGEDDSPRVRIDREDAQLTITLTRPDRLNALDTRMRDELDEALAVAAADPSVEQVELRGEGRAFCAGGDLDEFGTRPDPARAHLVRLQRNLGRTIFRLRQTTAAYIHGPTMGSGIELAAFADQVVAAPDTQIALPELTLGLVPGAGGTVSLPRRIGRLRAAWLAFSGSTIDAEVARDWGLADAIGT
jgi:enoyl-CoA hydratase/carnithine racemase